MDPGLLTAICQSFRDSILPLAPQLVDLLHPSWFVLVRLSFLLLMLSLLCGAPGAFVGDLLLGTLAIGFTHVLLLFGWQWAGGFFEGTIRVAQLLGAPGIDPSGIVNWGWTMADPIFKALDSQGVLSFVTSPFMHLTFEAGAWAIAFAFIMLAIMQMGFLLMSYVLVGTAPFFCLFAVLPVLRSLTMRWVSLVFSTMSGLFVTMIIGLAMQNIGQGMLETLQSKFLVTGTTLLLTDYLMPLGVGVVLLACFVWIPLRFAGQAGGASMDILSATSALVFGAGGAAVSAAQNSGGGGGKSGSTTTITNNSGAGGGGGGGGGSGSNSGMGKPVMGAPQWS